MEVENPTIQDDQGPGFHTYLMTGEAIIRVNSTPRSSPCSSRHSSGNTADNEPNSVEPIDITDNASSDCKLATTNSVRDARHDITNVTEAESVAANSVMETSYDKKEFVSGFMRVDDDDLSQEVPLTDSNSGSMSSLGDISLDLERGVGITPVDEPSATRLAKRLFMLDGFKKSDVAFHLTKTNGFSQKVAEEYLNLFDFINLSLINSMRKFFDHFVLVGETQERERVLAHFTHRYMECNPDSSEYFHSEDACHTLTCALMLLNTDLHGQNLGRKMTLADFSENLAGLNGGENYPKDLLKMCYSSIKQKPFTWAVDDDRNGYTKSNGVHATMPQDLRPTDHPVLGPATNDANVFLDVPISAEPTEYKRGFLMKKQCKGPDGVKTPSGKRGWKKHFVVLRDMALYLAKSPKLSPDTKVLHIHHSLAKVARNYKKRQFTFTVQTADWSEYLFATSDAAELEDWVNTVNLVTATLSAEPLAAAVGSQQKFHRPLLPVSHTRLHLADQCKSHELRVLEIRKSLAEEEMHRPERNASKLSIQNYTDKLRHLQYELQRYVIYAQLIRAKLDQYPDLDITLVTSSIGEDDEDMTSIEHRGPANRYSYQQAVAAPVY